MKFLWEKYVTNSHLKNMLSTIPIESDRKRILRYDTETKGLIDHIEKSFELALNNSSKITKDILNIPGLSGNKTRHLYNNLASIQDTRYLEIGTWKGSTVCSAMYNNQATVVCIDNWSEFQGAKDDFLVNFTKFKGENNALFIEDDCFNIDVSKLPNFNIYLYDGDHKYECHYKALIHFWNCLDNLFIYIVDDWNWDYVRHGTYDAITKMNCEIVYQREMRTTNDNTHPEFGSEGQKDWHNGISVFILKK